VFDPFGDFETKGYLQNYEGIKDFKELKVLEHTFFEANLEDAFDYLKKSKVLWNTNTFCTFTTYCSVISIHGQAKIDIILALPT